MKYLTQLAETVNLHFLTLLEALLECGSILYHKLLPLWYPILHAHHTQVELSFTFSFMKNLLYYFFPSLYQLPGHMQIRLQNCCNSAPPEIGGDVHTHRRETNAVLLKWLHRLQFKMGQIEMQSSTAIQFYSI